MIGLLAKKVGMTQVFDDEGNLVPVTVIRIDPNTVIAQKTQEKDGYAAVMLGIDDLKPARVNKPYAGQFPEGITPKRRIREFRDFEKECAVGDAIGIELFEGVRYVDVTGTSKGKGFQGVIKRWGFAGGRASHGSKFHREPGGTGQSTYPGHTFKNMKLPGHMGNERTTTLSLKVIKVDAEKQVIMVRGAVPGINEGIVIVRAAVKK
ncbi:50S ribosomal protein L3 [Spirochaetia bacterium]|nr:50S ribosomal protein L3 [Spirochaetia bacterium]GHU84262.1 50S ribosomal protein L3 [Spirochaetia bacterium]